MKENLLISIIIPVYNVEKYLERCLDSVINQTYKNLEIIVIDDGSTDNSGKICDKYAEKDNRIIVIHKENGGICSARNSGLNIAKGLYILFIDSDDYIDSDYIELLSEYADENTIVCCGYRKVQNEKTIINSIKNLKICSKLEFLNLLQYFEMQKINPIGNYMWNKLFPIRIFENIRFFEGHVFEDIYISIKLFNKIEKFIIIPNNGYNYMMRNNSIVHSFNKSYYNDLLISRIEQEKDLYFDKNLLEKACVLTINAVLMLFLYYSLGMYEMKKEEIVQLKEIIRTRKKYISIFCYKTWIKIFLILYADFLLKFIYKTKRYLYSN